MNWKKERTFFFGGTYFGRSILDFTYICISVSNKGVCGKKIEA